MSKDHDDGEMHDVPRISESSKATRHRDERPSTRSRSRERRSRERRSRSRTKVRRKRPAPPRSCSSSVSRTRGRTPRRRKSSSKNSKRHQRRRRSTSRRLGRRGSRYTRAQSRPSRARSRSRSPAQDARKSKSRRDRNRASRPKRRHRETVSPLSSSTGSYTTKCGDKSSKISKRSRTNDKNSNESNFSINDVMELIKSLPSATSQVPNHFSMTTNAVPEFDPANKEQTINLWITKVEECADLYKWSEIQLIHYALPKLVGVAKVWYQGLPSLNYGWQEWKEKLMKTFPTVQNYAQLLHEMLERKVRHNESLETYFYHKINLLNRCDITGKRAVDCLIYGLEDKGMRLGAQAANYSQPEDLLSYFKSIKLEDVRDKPYRPTFVRRRLEGQTDAPKSGNIKCFNCNEVGHPSFKCTKPLLTCGICKRIGHQSVNCKRLPRNSNEVGKRNDPDQVVSEIKLTGVLDEKYVLPIIVNGISKSCYVDLGSQSTLIRISDFKDLDMIFDTENLPKLKGFGNSIIEPLGKSVVQLQVQSVTTSVEVLIVPDDLLKHSVLLGHTFTEQAGIIIIKTDEHLIFQKQPSLAREDVKSKKLKLVVSSDVCVTSMNAIPVQADDNVTCKVYVRGSIRNVSTNKYYILPGLYSILNGSGCLLAMTLNAHTVTFQKGQLITRAYVFDEDDCVNINKLEIETHEQFFDSLKVGEEFSNENKNRLENLLDKYRDCFSFSLKELGLTNLTEMTITLKDTTPVVYRPYRLAYSERDKVKGMIQEMLDCGIITESTSSYASPIILVQKKTGDQRLCVDYRALNAKTVKEHYPLPRVEDQIDQLGGYDYFITLDLASGYYQIPIAPSSQDKTAFVTPDGQYQFTRMPFGLANAPSVFQKTINTMLKGEKNRIAFAFMDDIIIPAHSIEQGMERLEAVLRLIRQAGLTLKLSKCTFFSRRIDYLGFEISKLGVRPGLNKTEAVENFKRPTNQHEIRQFVGLASFFRRFVKDFAIIANPLTKLLKKDSKFEWGTDQEKSFTTLKSELVKRPILALYNSEAKTQVHTDACKTGIAGILLQEDTAGRWRAVAYYSRQTTVEEQKYHSFELETLAVIASLQRFRVYVLGIKFTIITDCSALRTTLSKRDMIPRVGRWWLQLQEYDCSIEYRPGNRMNHVDALSRNAIPIADEPEPVFDVLAVETEDWLTTIQGVDEEVQRIKRILEDSETPKISDVYQNYRLKNGKVYKVVDSQLKWLVPKGFRWQLLKKCHDELGHFGVDKTLDKLKSMYWFPKMNKFVKKYVQSCLECCYHKVPSGKRQGMLHPIPKIDKPFHTIHMDHLGPFVKSKSKNTYLLVLVEAYTKYITLYAVKNTKTKSTIKILDQYFGLFGIPSRLISDRGSSFTSKAFKQFMNRLGIRHVMNSVATPRANGQVERYNRTILASLAVKNHNCNEKEWDTHLQEIQLGLNTTINKATGKSPCEVLFGTRLRSKSDGIVASLLDHGESSTDNVQEIRDGVNLKISEEQSRQKQMFDKNRRVARKYEVGDLVRIEREIGSNNGQSRKLLPKLQGPYRIIKVLDRDRYVVQDTPMTRKQNRKYEAVISVDKIHPWLTFTRGNSSESESDECNDIVELDVANYEENGEDVEHNEGTEQEDQNMGDAGESSDS